jgi:hypothetical protein
MMFVAAREELLGKALDNSEDHIILVQARCMGTPVTLFKMKRSCLVVRRRPQEIQRHGNAGQDY